MNDITRVHSKNNNNNKNNNKIAYEEYECSLMRI